MMWAASTANLLELGASGPYWAIACMMLLFGLSFFFSGTETALFSLQKVERQRLKHGDTLDQRTSALLDRRPALITTILMGNETVNIAIAALGAALIAMWQPGRLWLNVVLLTPLLVLFSEITPKVLAFRFNLLWARWATWPVTVLFYVLWLPRNLITTLVRFIARLMRVPETPQDERLQEQEILDLIDHSTQQGDLHHRERELIEAVFEFDDLTVARVMTPRPDIFAVPLNINWHLLLRHCHEAGFSRIPVYRQRPDNILGVLLLKDLLGYRTEPANTPRELRSLLLPPVFVPHSKPADDMLREFLATKNHMAFVVDEHGTLVGLVTLDDLLAELLDHETDETPEIEQIRPGILSVKAWMDLADFQEETGIELPNGDYHTLGGFVFHQLGRLPQPGDTITCSNHSFTVGSMDGRRIVHVHVEQHVEAGVDIEREAG